MINKNLETDILYEICKGNDADISKIQMFLLENKTSEVMEGFMGKLAANRMCGMAYDFFRTNCLLSELMREYRTVLEAVYYQGVHKNRLYENEVKKIAEVFAENNIEYVALKGAYLMKLYPDGVRTSNDLDILTTRESVSGISSVLKQMGYEQGFIRNEKFVPAERSEIINAMLNRGETIPFVKYIGNDALKFMEIDINLSLNESPNETLETVKQMLSCREKIKYSDNTEIYILQKADFLIQLCVHYYKEATNESWIARGMDKTLYKLMDIYLFCKNEMNKDFSEKFREKVKKYGLEKECRYTINIVYKIWGFPKIDI